MSVVRVHGPSTSKAHIVVAFAGTPTTLYAVGGAGESYVLASTSGEAFEPLEAPGRGLRDIFLDGKAVWLVGESGHVQYSGRGFTQFRKINLKSHVCWFGIAKATDGSIYTSGDSGAFARSTGRRVFTRIRGLTGTLGKLTVTDEGVYLPSSAGLWRVAGDEATKLGLDKPIGQVLRTRKGTLVIAGGSNTIHRSTDGGKTFKNAALPPFAPVKAEYPSDWMPDGQDFSVVAELADGRIVAGGDQGVILMSGDDGKTFERVEHSLIGGSLWAAGTWKGRTYLGGERGIILRVD